MQATSMSASIVIDNYNYGRYLRQCIDSALAQTVATQVIVVDDASTDDSAEIVRSYGDDVVFIPFPVNRGQAAALNAGFAAATGDVVFLLDSDDWIVPSRVQRVLYEFAADRSTQAVRHDMSVVDVDGRLLSDRLYGFPITSSPARDVLRFGRTPGSGGCMGFRKSFLRDLGPIPEHCFRIGADYYLVVAAAISGELKTISESLYVRRSHSKQITSRFGTERSLVQDLLAISYCEAMGAAEVAKLLGGPHAIASGLTWWQLKATYERSKGIGRGGPWFSAWLRHLALTVRAQLPPGRKIGELGRSIALGLLPRRLFRYAWWRTHMGRPRLKAIDAMSTGRLLTTKGNEGVRHPAA
jgi:glycosyltransferase involved in cell wall biosynthesis